MKRPLVTVLMALYNGGEYLKQSVPSVLNQTYRDFEFLIINDCSTDNSLILIKSFQDERIKIFNNEKNLGQTRSLNIGLKLAQGDYVARIDADDIAFPGWLEHQLAVIDKDKGYAVVSTQAIIIDECNRVRRIYRSPTNKEDIILRSFTFSPINHVGSVFNREIILGEGGYEQEYKIAADYGLWSKLIRHGHKITSTDKFLIAIRAHGSSLSQAGSGKKELEDLSEIMQANIHCFTDFKITRDESDVLCRAFFAEKSLSNIEFNQVIGLLKKIYGSLLTVSRIHKTRSQKWMRKRCMAVYLKRINSCIKDKNYTAIKEIVRQGMSEFGVFSPLGILFVAHFLGKVFLDYVPMFCEDLMKFEVYIITKGKMRMADCKLN